MNKFIFSILFIFSCALCNQEINENLMQYFLEKINKKNITKDNIEEILGNAAAEDNFTYAIDTKTINKDYYVLFYLYKTINTVKKQNKTYLLTLQFHNNKLVKRIISEIKDYNKLDICVTPTENPYNSTSKLVRFLQKIFY